MADADAADTEPTIRIPLCSCASCTLRRTRDELGVHTLRVTTIQNKDCREDAWTVILTGDDEQTRAVGVGETEDAALYVALKRLGVAS